MGDIVMKQLNWLRDELKKIKSKDIENPGGVCLPTDKTIGKIEDPEVKRLFVVHRRLVDQRMQTERELADHVLKSRASSSKKPHNPDTCAGCRLGRDSVQLGDKISILDALLQRAVRECLDTAGQIAIEKIGHYKVCADWSIAVPVLEARSHHDGLPGRFSGGVRIVSIGDLLEMLGANPVGS